MHCEYWLNLHLYIVHIIYSTTLWTYFYPSTPLTLTLLPPTLSHSR